MKSAQTIINLIQNKPQFSKLTKFACIEIIQSLFSAPLKKMIKFAYIKNETLFFVLNHPGAKQEFDNNIQSIKSALKFHTPEQCRETTIKDMKAFVTHTPQKTFTFTPKKPQLYKERAKGDFIISVKDAKLQALMQDIKKIIQKESHDTP